MAGSNQFVAQFKGHAVLNRLLPHVETLEVESLQLFRCIILSQEVIYKSRRLGQCRLNKVELMSMLHSAGVPMSSHNISSLHKVHW